MIDTMTIVPAKFMTKEEIERGIERGEIEIEYKTRWAADENGIARPVGTNKSYKDTGEVVVTGEMLSQYIHD